ncbi:MAG: PhnD/SsuA/transferrin family substrate-binding protein [Burkholderiales bacterium]|nr:PhnD/SsuA/transferrin family substrate-binding protein [Burkholderiales bacterium]
MMKTRPMMRWMACWLLLACLPCLAATELRIGIEPFFSPRMLIASFQPLREQMATQLNCPVVLLTAPDYRQFLTHIHRHDYDLVIASAAGARYVQLHEGFVPSLKARGPYVGLLVTHRKRTGAVSKILADARVALPDPLSLTGLMGETWLDRLGVHVQMQRYAFQNRAIDAVLRGDADFAIVSRNALSLLASTDRAALTVVAETGEAPNAVLLASGDLDDAERLRYTDIVANFINNHGQNSGFTNMLGISGADPVAPGDLALVDPLMLELQRRLKAAM